ncbi:WLM-domain-containing protein [Dissoconium aciculare CBS 342.82]|uniref:WLM-domain-containing protein n=1 Tax=Dissoconium aciculare CBS 342.82 TaxID=1314786 RepID=A0A6J3LWD1_9PEZI|nr:WLM-domain-containing protein [Dissoconium aciculare CBS 342.82]KAF1819579.1 WLM-domain-containing protein [Dissoconium aciculare CBS 342.82]
MSRRSRGDGEPGAVQRSYTSELREHEPLFQTYEHLHKQSRGDTALQMLRKIASLVKPIMRKRSWHVQILAEFLPSQQNLLGLNVNKGYKICLRLRYHNNPDLFLPMEEIVDTMLHELSHIIWGDHDSRFHALWDELRDEYEVLVRKGYTGEGFLSEGRRLGGGSGIGGNILANTRMSPQEMRRLARVSAEKRKAQGALSVGSGRKLGGSSPAQNRPNVDIRDVIVDSIMRRNNNNNGMMHGGCASGSRDAEKISDQASTQAFKTQAEEDDANDRAIAQALYELMEQEEMEKIAPQKRTGKDASFSDVSKPSGTDGLAWKPEKGLCNVHAEAGIQGLGSASTGSHSSRHNEPSEEEQLRWAMQQSLSSAPERGQTAVSTTCRDDKMTMPRPPPIPMASKPALTSPSRSSITPPPTAMKRKQPPSPRPPPARSFDVIDLTATSPISNQASSLPDSRGGGDHWTCQICTCINPVQFLACDACGIERPITSLPQTNPSGKGSGTDIESRKGSNVVRGGGGGGAKSATGQPKRSQLSSARAAAAIVAPLSDRKEPGSLGWICSRCGAFMEHQWFTCSACGKMKENA